MERSRASGKMTVLFNDNHIPVPPGENKAYTEQQLENMENCLISLGHPCSEILKLFYYERKNMEEISINLGYKNADTVKNQKYKCLQRLRKLMKERRITTA
ncbi:sigma-70 family RNA polymerase sigma factor [Fulvivirga sp. RKSG066]|nr:sigma-70 family RNA polymerase sigma factor [Fulvivirga aurantia]